MLDHRLLVIILLLFKRGNQLFSQTFRHVFGCLTPKWKEIMLHSLLFVANHNDKRHTFPCWLVSRHCLFVY